MFLYHYENENDMRYTYVSPTGDEIVGENTSFIKEVLKNPYEYWLKGSGESNISIGQEDILIFFRLKEGFFIIKHPDYLSPLIEEGNLKYYEHYVGGEPMRIPSFCICDESVAYEIIRYYIGNKGNLLSDYQWIDIVELEE